MVKFNWKKQPDPQKDLISFAGFNKNTSLPDLKNIVLNDINKYYSLVDDGIEKPSVMSFLDFLIICSNHGIPESEDIKKIGNYITIYNTKRNNNSPRWGSSREAILRQSCGRWFYKDGTRRLDNDYKPYFQKIEHLKTLGDLYDYFDHTTPHFPQREKILKHFCISPDAINAALKDENSTGTSNNYNENSIESIIEEVLETNKQVIFTGAPGTGKTYSVRSYIKDNTENEDDYKFVQFHPSYDYSDFVEGLRPVTLENTKDPTFVRIDGVFKSFCRHIAEENLEIVMQMCSITDLETALETLYSYEKTKDKKEKDEEEQAMCEKLASVYNKKYYFVVDEINRADLSKVFGELMFGLEESYRGVSNRFDTQYKNLKTYQITKEGHAEPMEFDIFEKGFFIPQNLVFIGTMNDIDRSVESFDFALRRRFQWIDIKANEIMGSTLESMWASNDIEDEDDAIEKIIAMNDVITSAEFEKFGLSEAYHIGPAYFKSYDGTDESMETIFTQKIEPILREYTRGRKTTDVNDLVNKCHNTLLGK